MTKDGIFFPFLSNEPSLVFSLLSLMLLVLVKIEVGEVYKWLFRYQDSVMIKCHFVPLGLD
jgi:hypothetical protein